MAKKAIFQRNIYNNYGTGACCNSGNPESEVQGGSHWLAYAALVGAAFLIFGPMFADTPVHASAEIAAWSPPPVASIGGSSGGMAWWEVLLCCVTVLSVPILIIFFMWRFERWHRKKDNKQAQRLELVEAEDVQPRQLGSRAKALPSSKPFHSMNTVNDNAYEWKN